MAQPKTDHGDELFRTIYASRASVGLMPRFDMAVEEIVAVSQTNNARRKVTGLLLAHHGWFVQVLEGPRRQVSTVASTICRDPRHGQYETLIGGPVGERLFPNWTMCARRLTPEAGPVLDALELSEDFDPFRMDADRALRLLKGLSLLSETAKPAASKAA